MSKKEALKNVLKAEIILQARKLIKTADTPEFDQIISDFQQLYDKLAAYRFLDQSGDWDILEQPSSAVSDIVPEKFEADKKQTEIPEKKTPGKITASQSEHGIKEKAEFFKKAAETKFHKRTSNATGAPLQIGLADKIALLRNLFGNNAKVYEKFIEDVNQAETYEEALTYVNKIKKIYDWTGKDEYEFRLLQLIQARFA